MDLLGNFLARRIAQTKHLAAQFIHPVGDIPRPMLVLDGHILLMRIGDGLGSHSLDIVAINEERHQRVPLTSATRSERRRTSSC